MRLSTSGIIFVLAGAALIVTAYRFALPGLLPVGILMLALVLLSAALIALGTRQVSIAIRTALPDMALAPSKERYPLTPEGKEVEVEAVVTNVGQLAIPSSTIDFVTAEGFGDSTMGEVPALAHGDSQTVLTSFTPYRRGVSGIEAVLITVYGPFGLVKVKKKVHGAFPIAVSVPILGARIPSDSAIRPARLDEGKVRRGHTTRDFHTREYVPGDDLRHVHWPSTAKSGELMVRHEADEETLHALIVVDLAADPEPNDRMGAGSQNAAGGQSGARGQSAANVQADEVGPSGVSGAGGQNDGDGQTDQPARVGHPSPLEVEFLLAAAAAAGTAFLRADYEVFVVAPGHQIRFKGSRDIDRLRLLSALIEPGTVDLPAHDNPNHIVICAAGDQRGQELAAHFSRRVPVTIRTLSEIGDLSMLGLSEDLPESWMTFDSKRVTR